MMMAAKMPMAATCTAVKAIITKVTWRQLIVAHQETTASRSRRDAFSVSNATMPVSYASASRPATPAPRQRAKTRRSGSDTSGR